MHNSDQPILRDIVLVGGGHSHVGVLRRFAMQPLPGVRLNLICSDTHTPYSGMLPGYIAGHYGYDEVHIDLDRLCVFAGARLFRAETIGIDRRTKRVLCRDRPAIPYDLLSINIGSTPQMAQVPGAEQFAVPVKPIRQFNDRWLDLLQRVQRHAGRTTIAVVGGGAGGVELTLAMQYRLRNELQTLGRDPDELAFHLFTAGGDILPTHNRGVRRRFERVLAERGVTVHRDAEVRAVSNQGLTIADGQTLVADEVLWVTQAGGAPWLRQTGLALDGSGFIEVNDHLQSLTDPSIFAAGDIASIVGRPLEKAGVFAVRMGRPLADNLRLSVLGRPLRAYRPQRRWLALISTGDAHAVASRGAIGFEGDWVWRWKDWIDRRFMRRFSEFPAMDPNQPAKPTAAPQLPLTQEESLQAISAIAMRCGGCGAKVGATVLSRALGALLPVPRDDVLIGLHAPDDAAVVRVPAGMAMVHTVDFFRAFIDDPYVFGRVAANHALGDIFAMGGEAQSATAVATVPRGGGAQRRELRARRRPYWRRPRAGAGFCGQRADRRIDDRRDAQGRHAPRRRAAADQADRHRHAVRGARPAAREGPLDRRGAAIDAGVEPQRRADTDRSPSHGLHRPDRFRAARPPGGNDPAVRRRRRTATVGAAAAGRRTGVCAGGHPQFTAAGERATAPRAARPTGLRAAPAVCVAVRSANRGRPAGQRAGRPSRALRRRTARRRVCAHGNHRPDPGAE
jgi:selenide,water dikinase